MCTYTIYIYIVYIYIVYHNRESERERERQLYTYIYIFIRERERVNLESAGAFSWTQLVLRQDMWAVTARLEKPPLQKRGILLRTASKKALPCPFVVPLAAPLPKTNSL